MIESDKKLVRTYITNWNKSGLIKTSLSVQLYSAAALLETIEDFLIYAMKKVGICYLDLPKDYKNNTNFLVKAVLKLNNTLELLSEIAKNNKAMYLKVIGSLSEEEIAFVLRDINLATLPRTKLIAKLKKEVSSNVKKEY